MIGAFYIGKKQNEINENLLSLNFYPSVEVAYTPENKRIQIYNKGNSFIALWGTKDLQAKPNIKKEPIIITQNGSYYIFGDKLEEIIREKAGDTKEVYIPFDLYITGANNLKYVVKNRLFCEVSKDQVKIHSQTTAIERTEWKTNKL
jgi:hypothetical protein